MGGGIGGGVPHNRERPIAIRHVGHFFLEEGADIQMIGNVHHHGIALVLLERIFLPLDLAAPVNARAARNQFQGVAREVVGAPSHRSGLVVRAGTDQPEAVVGPEDPVARPGKVGAVTLGRSVIGVQRLIHRGHAVHDAFNRGGTPVHSCFCRHVGKDAATDVLHRER